MEELQAALKGNECRQYSLKHTHSHDLSADSLESVLGKNKTKPGRGSNSDVEQNSIACDNSAKSFYLHESESLPSEYCSRTSIYSEPATSVSKSKMNFIETAMTDYLNSHRHSLSSVMELIKTDDTTQFLFELNNTETVDTTESKIMQDTSEYENDLLPVELESYDEVSQTQPFYILSPIEEKSEPSTRSSSFRGSNGSEKENLIHINIRVLVMHYHLS